MTIFCLHFALNQSFLQSKMREMRPVSEMKSNFTEIFQREMLDINFIVFKQFCQEVKNDQKFLGWVWFISGQVCHVKFIKFVRSSDFNMFDKMTKYFKIFFCRSFGRILKKNMTRVASGIEQKKSLTQ